MASVSNPQDDVSGENETKELVPPEYSPKRGIIKHPGYFLHSNYLCHRTDREFNFIFPNWPGPTTLSTSTSSYEPLETHDPNLNRLAITMFDKVSEYLKSEMTSSESEYRLLEEMNKVTTAKYQDLTKIAMNVGKGVVELNEKCTTFWFFSCKNTY